MARKTIQNAMDNLRASTATIGPRYTIGIQGADWQGPASSDQAEQNWGTGVQRAIADGSRRTGILAVSNNVWQQLSISKGAAVIGQRVNDALDKYQRNFAPILSAMNQAASILPPRTASATQNVNTRLLPIIAAAKEAAGKSMN